MFATPAIVIFALAQLGPVPLEAGEQFRVCRVGRWFPGHDNNVYRAKSVPLAAKTLACKTAEAITSDGLRYFFLGDREAQARCACIVGAVEHREVAVSRPPGSVEYPLILGRRGKSEKTAETE